MTKWPFESDTVDKIELREEFPTPVPVGKHYMASKTEMSNFVLASTALKQV
jgi:hypothetical protein